MSAKGATIVLNHDSNRLDNLLFAEGGSRIIFSINQSKENEWLNFIDNMKNDFLPSIYVRKIGYVSNQNLKIKLENKVICNIKVEELAKSFNNSISKKF